MDTSLSMLSQGRLSWIHFLLSFTIVGRVLEFKEWACKLEGYSFLRVKSNSIYFSMRVKA